MKKEMNFQKMVLTLFEQAPVAQTNTLKKRFFEIFNSIILRVRARTVEKIFFSDRAPLCDTLTKNKISKYQPSEKL